MGRGKGGGTVQLAGRDLMLAFNQKPSKNKPEGPLEIKGNSPKTLTPRSAEK